MQVDQLVRDAKDTITVKRVYGDPLEKNGLTFIPVASVAGGGGGGSGRDKDGGTGDGGGFGATGRPAGAYVIKDGEVRWQPAVDVNRLVATLGTVVIVWLLTRGRRGPRASRSFRRRRRRRLPAAGGVRRLVGL